MRIYTKLSGIKRPSWSVATESGFVCLSMLGCLMGTLRAMFAEPSIGTVCGALPIIGIVILVLSIEFYDMFGVREDWFVRVKISGKVKRNIHLDQIQGIAVTQPSVLSKNNHWYGNGYRNEQKEFVFYPCVLLYDDLNEVSYCGPSAYQYSGYKEWFMAKTDCVAVFRELITGTDCPIYVVKEMLENCELRKCLAGLDVHERLVVLDQGTCYRQRPMHR